MNLDDLHRLIDEWAAKQPVNAAQPAADIHAEATPEASPNEEVPVRVLPEGKKVVRTKTSGDKVYYIDEDKKTRQWVANQDVLKALGFEMGDVVEMADTDLIKYAMGQTLYKVE